MDSPQDKYVEFAASVSFFEFQHEEFGSLLIKDITTLSEEIGTLNSKRDWDIDSLSEYVKKYPASFRVFEAMFQQSNFSHPQLIHFFFNVSQLNTADLEPVYLYAVTSLSADSHLEELFKEFLVSIRPEASYENLRKSQSASDKELIVAIFKMAVSEYASRIPEDSGLLRKRIEIQELPGFTYRFSNYLLDRLNLNEFLNSINLETYLKSKRKTRDNRNIHGKFGKNKVMEKLDRNGFENIDKVLKAKKISRVGPQTLQSLGLVGSTARYYCTEKSVEGVTKKKGKKFKQFDVILFSGVVPKHLFEINFYTTFGTKIKINEDEYIDLHESISSSTDYIFHWITDGNYWLTPNGREKFNSLIPRFQDIYNINTFEANLDRFR